MHVAQPWRYPESRCEASDCHPFASTMGACTVIASFTCAVTGAW
jgi:hypothetical protein